MKTVVKRPLITEKSAIHQKNGVYVFECAVDANKEEIKLSIEKLFNVKVAKVNTVICRNRASRTKYGYGKITHWKKASVKLAEGNKISIFEGV